MTTKNNKTPIDLTLPEVDYILLLTGMEVNQYKRLRGETDYYFQIRHQIRQKLVTAMIELEALKNRDA